jgi:hypothetical protein
MYIFAAICSMTYRFKELKTVKTNIKIKDVFFRDEKVFFSLEDGEIGAPLEWYPRLYHASQEELLDFSISPGGYGVHWKRVDEDLSAHGILNS